MDKYFYNVIIVLLLISIVAQANIPGQGNRVGILSDDFEDPGWTFNYNGSNGTSSNGLWRGSFRGAPEVLERMVPPAGGLADSSGALRIRSYYNGDDAHPTQEDLVSEFYNVRFGRYLSTQDMPNLVAYLYVPPYSTMLTDWATIGFRVEARTNSSQLYYPSIWVYLGDARLYFSVRLGDGQTSDIALANPQFFNWEGGWIKLGIAFDAEGVGHYYIKAGTSAFSAADKVYDTTMFPKGTDPKMHRLYYNFFSIGYPQGTEISPDFVVDDFSVYINKPVTCEDIWDAGPGLPAERNRDCKVDM